MRSFSRADAVPALLDALLEGSLVGIAYVTLFFAGPGAGVAPLSLVEFVAAAAAGLVWARLRRSTFRRRWLWLAPAIVMAGLLGWLADPAARNLLPDVSRSLQVHPAGWLLGLAVYRGAAHERTADEVETSSRALAFAFPVLAAPWILDTARRDDIAGVALVGAAVCVGAGLLSVAYARVAQLGLLGAGTRGGRTWPMLATSVVLVIAIVAIPAALLTGTSAREALLAIAGPIGTLVGAILTPIGEALAEIGSALGGLVPSVHLPGLPGAPSIAMPSWLSTLVWLAVGVAFVLTIVGIRRLVAGTPPAKKAPKVRGEERHLEIHRPRVAMRLPARARMPHVELPHRPRTAVEAYLALLREIAQHEPLARRTSETPQQHAGRASDAGLPALPMRLIAADYELDAYGGVGITERETRRALVRYGRLRSAAHALGKRR